MFSRITTFHSSFCYTLLLILILLQILFPYGSGFRLKLIPRQEFDSELFPKNLTLKETHERLVQLSTTRALSFRSTRPNNETTPQVLQPRVISVFTGMYAVQTMIGTPRPFSTFLLMDTGSDDAWLQCDGCVNCFPLGGGGYKYHESTTYKIVSCDHPLCIPKLCVRETSMCEYSIQYAGGGITRGIVSSDNITFHDTEGVISFPGVLFGCGFDNRNIVFAHNFIAGIIGLGTGPRSILMQLSPITKIRFSYCLTPFDAQPPLSYIWFGDDAKISGNYKTTPLIEYGLPRYFVPLLGIAMDGANLPIDPYLFALKIDKSGGFVLDTGSGVTFMVKSAYAVVRSFLVSYFGKYKMAPVTGRRPPLYDLCYNFPPAGTQYSRPSMTYKLLGNGPDNADLVLDPSLVFQDSDDMFCFVVMPCDDAGPTILGALQMINYRFLIDVIAKTVSFVPETCSTRMR